MNHLKTSNCLFAIDFFIAYHKIVPYRQCCISTNLYRNSKKLKQYIAKKIKVSNVIHFCSIT